MPAEDEHAEMDVNDAQDYMVGAIVYLMRLHNLKVLHLKREDIESMVEDSDFYIEENEGVITFENLAEPTFDVSMISVIHSTSIEPENTFDPNLN